MSSLISQLEAEQDSGVASGLTARPQTEAGVAETLAAAALALLQNMSPAEKLAFATVEAAALHATETEASLRTMASLFAVLKLPHARNCPARICDCDLEDTVSHVLRSAEAVVATLGGKGQ